MDPIAARTTLQIPPDAPLSLELIDAAYQRELWLRHPSRYPDAEGRGAAEAWRDALGRARAVLVAELASPVARVAVGREAAPRGRLSGGAVAAIVAGGVVLVAVLVAAGIGLFGLVRGVAETAIAESAESAGPGAVGADVERYESYETGYEFPAALELYWDGRYDGDCAIGFVEGCWQAALFTEADCDALEVTLAFNDDAESWVAEETQTRLVPDARADEAIPVVFGNDGREFGWIDQVRCTDRAST
ncbi:hypothetical protein GCM10017608_21170 [Agromyces luteolus]|uniref:Uncharacterized protein n=1 Tax=Agromyces luteolus TaxID=88373 RepID=A0A7C9I290_9MICO|nr:hypothetical protein [Agromyces luteolus]MUN08820.1 hypothetical protein [Agromyces luteolus]GLK28183.1 hypothetical protein GCM10017608_21170 [Agromyces luteolus]